MNDFFKVIENIQDGDVCVLENGAQYHLYQENLLQKEGYFCSNTTSVQDNPKGFHRTALFLKNKKNIVIDGNDATIIIHGIATPILLDACVNITVKNLTIDYARPTMSEFTVVSYENNCYTIKINEGCLYEIVGNTLVWVGEKNKDGNPYWRYNYKGYDVLSMVHFPDKKKTIMMKVNDCDRFPSVPTFKSITEISPFLLKVELEDKTADLPVGGVIQSRNVVRNEVGSFLTKCNNIKLENMRVMFMHGLGFLAQYCENIKYDNLNCLPKHGRTAASNADFFHFSGCRGNIVVENCVAGGAQDDFINVHGTHLQIYKADYEKQEIYVRFANKESWGFEAFVKGDIIDFVKWDTLRPYHTSKIIKVTRLNDTCISLAVDSVPTKIEIGKDVVENSSATASLTVQNNRFECSGGRGILCTTRKEILIKNNFFENICGAPLIVEDDCNFWFESGYTTDVKFIDNQIINCSYGFFDKDVPVIKVSPQVLADDSVEYVHKKVLIKNNIFKNREDSRYNILLSHTETVTVEDNCFYNDYDIQTKDIRYLTVCNNRNMRKK